jgi:hypothetical protein
MNEVSRENLKPGKLYYIICMNEDVPNKNLSTMVGIFKNLILIDPITITSWYAAVFEWFDISEMKNIKNESDAYKYILQEVQLNNSWRFYEVKKFKIQNDMESRAVKLFLQRIIGDQYFTPINT